MEYDEYNNILVDYSGLICFIYDVKTTEIVYMTKACMELLKITKAEEYVGHKCYEIIGMLKVPYYPYNSEKYAEGKEYHLEQYNEKLGRWLSISNTLLSINGRLCHITHVKNIFSQQREQTFLSKQISEVESIIRCLNILTKQKNMTIAMNSFLKTVGDYYQADRAHIIEFNFESQTLSNTFEWCAPECSEEIDNLQDIPLEVVSQWIKKFEETGSFYISCLSDDLDHESEDYRILQSQGIQGLLATPLIQENVIAGFIEVDNPRANINDFSPLWAVSEFVLEELEKRRLINKLTHMSYTDLLTGAKNRNCYSCLLENYDRCPPSRLGVIFVDINELKRLNDTQGHYMGDCMIKRTADIMREHLAGELFRLGGDEFLTLWENISLADFEEKTDALHKAFDEDQICNVSLGWAWQEDGIEIHALIRRAEMMMYADKRAYYQTDHRDRRNRFYTGQLDKKIRDIKNN